jgi:hypothetical protein
MGSSSSILALARALQKVLLNYHCDPIDYALNLKDQETGQYQHEFHYFK